MLFIWLVTGFFVWLIWLTCVNEDQKGYQIAYDNSVHANDKERELKWGTKLERNRAKKLVSLLLFPATLLVAPILGVLAIIYILLVLIHEEVVR